MFGFADIAIVKYTHPVEETQTVMTYVIAEPCINTKDTACVDACPVDCIHPKKRQFALGVLDAWVRDWLLFPSPCRPASRAFLWCSTGQHGFDCVRYGVGEGRVRFGTLVIALTL
jgi:NAD-dependent dihydropyrimidine dehydrogenase PreA subunit